MQEQKIHGVIHYPFISYKVDHKLKGSVTSSQQMVKQKESIDPKTGQFNKEKYFKDSKGNIWEVTAYYGVKIDKTFENKPKWIKRIDIFNDKSILKLKENEILLRPNDTVMFLNKDGKKEYKVFKAKMGEKICAFKINTTYIPTLEKNKLLFGKPNYYDTLGNWKKELQILTIDILGNYKS